MQEAYAAPRPHTLSLRLLRTAQIARPTNLSILVTRFRVARSEIAFRYDSPAPRSMAPSSILHAHQFRPFRISIVGKRSPTYSCSSPALAQC